LHDGKIRVFGLFSWILYGGKGCAHSVSIGMRGKSCPYDRRVGVNFADLNAIGHVHVGIQGQNPVKQKRGYKYCGWAVH
jgi:hypothetical protein